MIEIKYFFKRIWHYYILNEAYYITFYNVDFKLGEVVQTTYGSKMKILSKPVIERKYCKYLIINI